VTFGTAAIYADATVEQNTKVKFGGAIGRVVNFFAGKASREGIDSTDVVKGDRRAHRAGDNGEIVDLAEEKVYRVDYRRKTYSVKTFDEMRKEFEEAQERAKQQQAEQGEAEPQPEEKGPEYEVHVDIKETGKHETIAGYDTRQVIVTVTIQEKGKKLEEAGGWILTSDLWLGPRVPALEELWKFNMRFAQKLWGKELPSMDMQSMAQILAAAPAFADAMKAFAEKRDTLDGTPIRTTLTFETVLGTAQQEARNEEASSGSGLTGRVIGGLLSRRKKAESKEGEPRRSMLFTSTDEIRRAELTADPAQLAIPAGFKLRD